MDPKPNSQTERLRRKLMGTAREHWIDIVDDEGEPERVLLMAPKVRRANAIITECIDMPKGKEEITADEVKIDLGKLQVLSLIECLRDADTKEAVLQLTDKDALLDGPFTYLFRQLGQSAANLVKPDGKAVKKNSSPTTAEEPSSDSQKSAAAP